MSLAPRPRTLASTAVNAIPTSLLPKLTGSASATVTNRGSIATSIQASKQRSHEVKLQANSFAFMQSQIDARNAALVAHGLPAYSSSLTPLTKTTQQVGTRHYTSSLPNPTSTARTTSLAQAEAGYGNILPP